MSEEWRAIPGHEGYEASSLGRIRSLDRVRVFDGRWGVTRRKHAGKLLRLKPKENGFGGVYLCFYADGGSYPQVNRAVCAAFHGPAPSPKHEAAHLDGESLNNCPGNLAWATPVENASHKIVHGTVPIGERNGCAKLKGSEIEPIFDGYIAGVQTAELGALYGVRAGTINAVVARATWLHIPISEAKVLAARARAQANIIAATQGANAERSRLARRLPRPEGTGPICEEQSRP